jgi:hypothetical protein
MRLKLFLLTLLIAAASCFVGLAIWPQAPGKESPKKEAAGKSRPAAPKEADIDKAATAEALLAKNAKGDWSDAKGATLAGYVVMVEKEEDGDIKIFLAAKQGEMCATGWMFLEVPTSWQKNDPSLSEKSLRALVGKKVKVTGWLFFDEKAGGAPRGTKWELHPVTSIEVAK